MRKNKLKQFYKNKIEELNKHNQLYYEKSKPGISDADYDNLKNEILELENKFPDLKLETKDIKQQKKIISI